MAGSASAESATAAAIRKLKELIFTGELVAGSSHLESELAERLGMSRTPVREATIALAANGLLEVRPRKGARIVAVSVQDMAEIYEILTELESLAVYRAAQASYSKSDLELLFGCIDAMDEALSIADRKAWAQADEAFHTELVRLGGSRRIQDIVSNVNDQVRRARSVTLNLRPLPTRSNRDHRKLCRAILKGDACAAHELHRKHRKATGKLLTGLLAVSGLKQV